MKPIGGLFLLLLLGVGLYLYLSAQSAQTVITQSKPARAAAEEVSGQGMKESFDLEPAESNGKVTGLTITRLDPAGPLAKMYAVQQGDIIVTVGPFNLRDYDAQLITAQLLEAGQRQHKLTVLRNGQQLTLENHGAAAQMGGKSPALPGLPVPVQTH